MRLVPLCLLVAAFTAMASASIHHRGDMRAGEVSTFEAFKLKYGRSYADAVEEARRRTIFSENLERIADARRRNPHATFGVNQFADMTYAELSAKKVHKEAKPLVEDRQDVAPDSYPKAIDWRKKGAVTPVMNEGQCGAVTCGIVFAENVEGVWAANGFELTPLSVMPAMLCAYPGECGCFLRQTYDFFMQNYSGRVPTNASWPYNNDTLCEAQNQCTDPHNLRYGARITAVVEIAHNETAMAYSVGTNGPIAIEVSAIDWQTYSGGVMTSCGDSYGIDHVAAIVGYDETAQPPYWIIKNQWGTWWGEEGYVRVAMFTNQCGLTARPMTVSVL